MSGTLGVMNMGGSACLHEIVAVLSMQLKLHVGMYVKYSALQYIVA